MNCCRIDIPVKCSIFKDIPCVNVPSFSPPLIPVIHGTLIRDVWVVQPLLVKSLYTLCECVCRSTLAAVVFRAVP